MKTRWRVPQSEPVVIAFAGDTMPRYEDHGGIAKSEDLTGLLHSCDLVMANLESPLTTAGSFKTGGSSLFSIPSSVLDLQELNISLVSLANNHIMDRGRTGLEETLDVLDKSKIAWLGAGLNSVEAAQTHVWSSTDFKMVFLSFSYEASDIVNTAGYSRAGANPLLMSDAQRKISAFKEQGYLVCVSYHGGEQFFRIPFPKRQTLFRLLAESGADIVIGHHAHVFQGIETFDNKIVAYGLGNFLMTTPFQSAHKGTAIGLLLLIEVDAAGPLGYTAHFVYNDRKNHMLSLIHGEAESILQKLIDSFSRSFKDQKNLIREWQLDCCRMLMSMNEVNNIHPVRRLYSAGRRGWSILKADHEEKMTPPKGERALYSASKNKQILEGIRGIPLMLSAPGKFTECYTAYNEVSRLLEGNNDRNRHPEIGNRHRM